MSSQSNPGPSSSAPPLPLGFRTIEQIQSMPSDSIRAGEMVSVMGFVKDFQPPVRTKGTDHKCSIEIKDHSVQYESVGLKIIIFWPLEKMPRIQGASDAVLVRNAKTQMWGGVVSILANVASEFHILPSTTIPKTLSQNAKAPWQSAPPSKCRPPSSMETTYIIWANNHITDLCLPGSREFQERTQQAMTIKHKFCLLKDVKPDSFYDILGEVVKVYEGSGSMTVYLSDYTANSLFYNYVWGNGGAAEPRDGDEFGYIKSKSKTTKEWPGPYGKMSLQITLFDNHADLIRDEKVQAKQWLLLKNVQIKFGRMGGCLEGVLRGDRGAFEGKVQVRIIEQSGEPDQIDIRWKDAVRRKHEWWKKFEKQKQDILDEAAGLGDKRKRGVDVVTKNARQRRKELRAAAGAKVAEAEARVAKRLDLNDNIRSIHPDQPIVPVHVILKHRTARLKDEFNTEFVLPFNVCKYKANVRVVNYFPDKVEDFAVGRRVSEYDILSDYSGGEDTDIEADHRLFKDGKGFAKKYEWRFALEVEDADPAPENERMWLLVDNHSAEGLLNLDATNLRGDQDVLRELKEQLCILWGNLEEHKSALLEQQALATRKSSPTSSLEPESSDPQPYRKAGEQPNVDSEDDNEAPRSNLPSMPNSRQSLVELANSSVNQETSLPIEPVSNKAFSCCIRQYGAKVDEEDPSNANAGHGKKWKRMFGLFGTQII